MLTFDGSSRRGEACLSDLKLDRLRVGEVDDTERAEIDRHLQGCEVCRSRRTALQGDADGFATHTPARGQRRLVVGFATLAAAAAVLLLVQLRPGDPGAHHDGSPLDPIASSTSGSEPGTRTKGGPRLGVVVQRAGRTFDAGPDDALQPGDALRFHYTAHEAGHLAILGVDGAGAIAVHHPEGDRTQRVEAAVEQALESSVILDDVIGPETIYGVFCTGPQSVDVLRQALASDPHAPRVPAGCVIDRIVLDKRPEAR